MKNCLKLVGIIAMIVVIGFSMTACGNSLNGKWVADGGYTHNGIEFSGKKFSLASDPGATANFLGSTLQAQNGTYSISDNKIELKFSDGRIDVRSFSRTENTMTIGSTRLTRKN